MDWKKHGVVKVHDYTFDVENRLTSIFTNSTHTMSFAYDADGQRVKTTRTDGTVIYSPFPDYEVEDPSTGANIIRTTYRVAGQIVAVQTKVGTNSVFRYTYTDHLGNIVALSQGNSYVGGSLARYDPFGNYRTTPDESVNPDITNHGFTGHRMNNTGEFPIEKVGLIYMNARYYLPEVGRFISPDTIVPDPGYPKSYNRYSYTNNNPVKYMDPSGHTPWDIIDAIFFGISAYQFAANPTWGNAGWLTVDTVSLLPILPSVGWVRYGDEAAQLYSGISRAITHIRLEGGQNLLRVLNRFDDGGQLAFDFLKIADVPGAQKISRNLANGAWQTIKGSRFELEYAVGHADDILEIGRSLGGGREIDFVLKNGGFVDIKNYNWALDYYQSSDNMNRTISGFIDQARIYQSHSDLVTFAFNGSVPDAVRAALEAMGVIVQVIP